MRARQVLVATLAAAWLGVATAHAEDGHGAEDHGTEHVEHVDDHGAHAADGHATDEHAEDHGGHHYNPAGDEDGDGVTNWRDRTTGEADNDHYMVSTLLWHTFNLLVLVGLLVFFVRKPLGNFLQARAEAIRTDLDEADALRRDAHERNESLAERLDRFDEELARIREDAAARSEEDRVKLMERAQRAADQIRDNAQRNIRDEVARAKLALRQEAVDLAVKLAESTLRVEVSGDDQRRLARQFLDSLRDEEVTHG